MARNCPRCGRERLVCACPPNAPTLTFWKGNDLSEDEARAKGDLAHRTWLVHHLPNMRDCRRFNYGYAVVNDRVICEACGDFFDITDEVVERSAALLGG